jgi:hypothetical protein
MINAPASAETKGWIWVRRFASPTHANPEGERVRKTPARMTSPNETTTIDHAAVRLK